MEGRSLIYRSGAAASCTCNYYINLTSVGVMTAAAAAAVVVMIRELASVCAAYTRRAHSREFDEFVQDSTDSLHDKSTRLSKEYLAGLLSRKQR